MSKQEKPLRSNYFTDKGEHESLSLETLDNGKVRIKFYSLKEVVNPDNFLAKLNLIEKSLNNSGWYIEGRPDKEEDKAIVAGEIADKSTSNKPLLTVKGANISTVFNEYKEKRKSLDAIGNNGEGGGIS